MRTTPDIDDDILLAAKEMARLEGATAGQVVSRLLRNSLTGASTVSRPARARRQAVAGFRPFPAKPGVVATNDQVNALRDAEGAWPCEHILDVTVLVACWMPASANAVLVPPGGAGRADQKDRCQMNALHSLITMQSDYEPVESAWPP